MTQYQMDAQSQSQLSVINELNNITSEIGCEFWLRGGWAIDFLLGRVTRAHSDIDLVTWIHQREPLEKSLSIAGFKKIPVVEQYRDRQIDFRKNCVDISIGYLSMTTDDELIMNGLTEWKWRTDSLSPQFQTLEGVSARTLNPRQLLEEKIVYEQIGRKLRPKDIESKKILLDLVVDDE